MRLVIKPMSESEAYEYVGWRYEAPYDIFNILLNPEEMRQHIAFCVDPVNEMHSIHNASGEMIGFCVFGADAQINGADYCENDLDIGMGVRPDYTGQGLGVTFAEAVINFGKITHNTEYLRVTILDYNKRAQRVWERLGFEKTQEFVSLHDGGKCVVMRRPA